MDNEFFTLLDTYLFQKRPLLELLKEYKKSSNESETDGNGKVLYGYLLNEIRSMRKDREDLVDIVVKYILENESDNVTELTQYLLRKIEE